MRPFITFAKEVMFYWCLIVGWLVCQQDMKLHKSQHKVKIITFRSFLESLCTPIPDSLSMVIEAVGPP